MDKRIKNSWSEGEDEFLKKHYLKMTRKEMAQKLGRTLDSINKRMDRYLKLNKDESLRRRMIGRKFGLLTVVSFVGRKDQKSLYNCKCKCENNKIASYDTLIGGNTKSCGCLRRKNLEKTQYKAMYKMYKYSAWQRDIDFKLSFRTFKKLTSQNCYYCDALPSKKMNVKIPNERRILVNGIDRKVNFVGYQSNNCVPCCASCNYMKKDMNEKDFLNKIDRIHGNILNG